MINTPYNKTKPITFGVCSDIHHDIMHDAPIRLQTFVNVANKSKTDFNIQLGDFCLPKKENRILLDIWETLNSKGYHVLGNHDMDGGYKKNQVISYLSMPNGYYSFDKNNWHFVILDSNELEDTDNKEYPKEITNPLNPPKSGYPRNIGEKQLTWLRKDLQATDFPVIIFSHHPIDSSIKNSKQIMAILEEINIDAGWQKILACFNGHQHLDYEVNINGIWYIKINSMSNKWMGENYISQRYAKEIDEKFPTIKYTAPYKDPLYAIVTLKTDGSIQVKGTQSTWVGIPPEDMGYLHKYVVPRISSRTLYKSK